MTATGDSHTGWNTVFYERIEFWHDWTKQGQYCCDERGAWHQPTLTQITSNERWEFSYCSRCKEMIRRPLGTNPDYHLTPGSAWRWAFILQEYVIQEEPSEWESA